MEPSLTAVVTQFPAPSQTFILRKLRGLREAGMEVTVAATRFNESDSTTGFRHLALMPWRTPRVALEPASRPAWTAVATSLRRAGTLRPSEVRPVVTMAPITALDTDIAHFEFSGIAVSYLDLLPTLRERMRIAVSCRGAAEQIEPFTNPARKEALGRVFELADLIHCVSDDMRRTVEELGAPPDRILVNRPAVPVADFAPLRGRDIDHGGPFRLLSIGRLHWKKGLDDGLRAVSALIDRGIEVDYRIAGEGTEREKLRFLSHELGLDGSVSLLGVQTSEQVRDLLGWADALLLPSLSEGISNAVLEAMAAGLPVVTTDCGGMTEVVEHDVNGLVCGIGDVTTMGELLAVLATGPEERSRLGGAAAATADERLDLGFQVDRFLDAYRRIAAG